MSTLEADDSRTGEDSFVGGTPVVQKKVGAQRFVMLTRGGGILGNHVVFVVVVITLFK